MTEPSSMRALQPPENHDHRSSSAHGPRRFGPLVLSALLAALVGCPRSGSTAPRSAAVTGPILRSVNLNDPVRPVPQEGGVSIAAAKNEWASFAIQLDRL